MTGALRPLVVYPCADVACRCWGWSCRACREHATTNYPTADAAMLAALDHEGCDTAAAARAAAREFAALLVELQS